MYIFFSVPSLSCFNHSLAPSAPPQDFMIKTVIGEPTMLHFSWDPPPDNKQNGNITSYSLSCNPDPFGGVPKVFHQSSNIDVTLDGFKPATTYQCRVSAGTSAGYGPDGTIPIMTLESSMYDIIATIDWLYNL